MRAIATRNVELIREVLTDARLWEVCHEDGAPGPDHFVPETEYSKWIALVDHQDNFRGFVLASPLSNTMADVHVMIRPEYWGWAGNVELGKLAVQWLWDNTTYKKLVACIPVSDKQVFRYACRVGFKREGVNRASFLRNGELLDQYYMGLQRPE